MSALVILLTFCVLFKKKKKHNAVPSNLLEFIDAPTPYVMGVHVDQMASLGSLSDVIVVDCDRHTMTLPSFFVPLPEDLQSYEPKITATSLCLFVCLFVFFFLQKKKVDG